MFRNYKGCLGTIKALLGLRVKQFGRVLVPFAAGCAALGAPFLGCGQPADDKGGACMYRHIWVGTNGGALADSMGSNSLTIVAAAG